MIAYRTGPKPRAEDVPFCLRCRKKRRNEREKAQREAEQRAREQRRKEREERRASREPYARTLPTPSPTPSTQSVLFAQIEQLIASEVARRLEAHPDVLFARKIRAALEGVTTAWKAKADRLGLSAATLKKMADEGNGPAIEKAPPKKRVKKQKTAEATP